MFSGTLLYKYIQVFNMKLNLKKKKNLCHGKLQQDKDWGMIINTAVKLEFV